ncbi:SMP-30/gluconolactonase/LRE family protein [Polaromonas sp. P1-6]|nr:SMP-30/gluconolactonase/LRE family protein [Polaromonas sp. P1-6]
MPGFQRFDSLAVEATGNICVATLVAGCIAFVSPDGAVLGHVQMPGDEPVREALKPEGKGRLTTSEISPTWRPPPLPAHPSAPSRRR